MTIGTLKAIDHLIIYAADNINELGFKCDYWNIECYWSSDLKCCGQYKRIRVQKQPLKYRKLIDHPIKYATDNINVLGLKCDHWNIECYWSSNQYAADNINEARAHSGSFNDAWSARAVIWANSVVS